MTALPTADIVSENYREVADIEGLAESIRVNGLALPILVEPLDDGRWLLIDGDHRLTACRDLLGWETIPATIREATARVEQLAARLTANVSRRDSLPHEDGLAILAMMGEGETVEQVAARIGKGPQWCRDRVTIAQGASDATKDALRTGMVGPRLALRLANLDENRQRIALACIVAGDLSQSELSVRLDKLAADQSAESVEAFSFAIEEWTEAKAVQVGREATAADTMPLGRSEVADLLGVRAATVGQWITRDLMPAPDGRISGSPVWHRETVTAWATETGRI